VHSPRPTRRKNPKQRRFSTQTYLFGLVAAVVIPVLAFAAFLLIRYAVTERGRFESDAAQIARQVALVVDGELMGLVALLTGLATSSALATNDLAQFHVEANRLVDGRDEIVVLRDLGSGQLLNTRRPFGTPLPPAVPLSPADQAAFAAGRPVLSEVYVSPLTGELRIAVALPIARDGAPVYVLAITVPTSRIRDALLPAVPPGWIVGVGDRNGAYVTRSTRHEDVTGKPGLPEYLAKAVDRSGTFTSSNRDGVALLAGYYRSEFSGWLFAANIPQETVEAPLWQSLTVLATLGTAALTLSALLAYLFGKGFTAATTGLAQRAAALGEGRPVPPMPSRVAEFALVGDALASAAAAVEERARERQRTSEQLRLLINELNHRVKNMLATVQSIALHTLRGTVSMEQARKTLTDRLVALAKVHDVLTRESWEGAELRDIIAGVTSPHDGGNRFVVNGPAVWLTPALSVSLALALHELVTNAAKYGALSAERGSVTISWEVTDPPGDPRLWLRWVERGGPPVRAPTRQGFGSQLIERSLSAENGGKATIDYAAEGLVCLMETPLRHHAAPVETIPAE
jgi:two-component sensor histidine kinase